MMDTFIFGAGYSGKAFGREVSARAAVAGTTRSHEKFSALEAAGIAPFAFDGIAVSDDIARALSDTTHLVVSIAPNERETPSHADSSQAFDPVLAVARDIIVNRMPDLRWIGYLSTVGVYGDHQGAWIDETAECRPKSARSQRRVAAELEWLDIGSERNLPVAILRLSGIYGPGRNALVNLRDGTAKRLVKKDQVFNRIHVDDIAGALWHLAEAHRGGVFNITDDLPAPPQDVVTYAASLMGVEPPPEIPFEAAHLSPMARTFYGENKRVSNDAIRQAGYDFRYPTYQAAFDSMWADGSWAEGEPRNAILK